MEFAKVIDGNLARYPYHMADLRKDMPHISYPKNARIWDYQGTVTQYNELDLSQVDVNENTLSAASIYQQFEIVEVKTEAEPTNVDLKWKGTARFSDGRWVVPWETRAYTAEESLSLLESAKDRAYAEVNRIRDERMIEGIPFTTATSSTAGEHLFGDGLEDLQNIKASADSIRASALTMTQATGGYWKSKEGVKVVMTEAEFLAMSKTVSVYIAVLAREAHQLKDSISNLAEGDTPADVTALVEGYKTFHPLASAE